MMIAYRYFDEATDDISKRWPANLELLEIDNTGGVSLAATGLDAITATAPTGVASTFPQMVVQLWRRFFKKAILDADATTLKTYGDDGTTVVTTQTVTTLGNIETQGPST